MPRPRAARTADRPPENRPRSRRPAGAPAAGDADLQLVEAIRRGSEAHFNELYERYFQRIYNFIYSRLHNHEDTEEVVQETFTAVFRSIRAFRGQSTLLSWIYGIAKNTANNYLRRSRTQEMRRARAASELTRPASLAEVTPEEHLALRRYADAINRRLREIAAWQAEVFLLRHEQDLPIREIAERTARTNDAVRSSLCRVKRMLVEAGEMGRPRSGA